MEPTTGPAGPGESDLVPVGGPIGGGPIGGESDDAAAIERYLRTGRSALVARARLHVTSVAIRVATGAFIALAVGAAQLPLLDVRSCAILAGLALLIGVTLSFRAARQLTDELAVARALRPVEPALADELRSLLELDAAAQSGRLMGGRIQSGGAFLLLLRRRVAAALLDAPLDRVLPPTRARRGLARSIAISLGGLALVGLIAPRLYTDLLSTLRRGRIAAPPSADAPPIVGDLELELHPPAYTGLPPRRLPASSGDVRVLRGTEILVSARSLVGAVRKAALRVEPDDGKPVTLPAEVARREARDTTPVLKGQFTVAGPGAYRFVLSRWTGHLTEPLGHRIEIEPDLAPRVDLRAPGDPLELAVPRPVELAFEAEDDFGVGEVALVYRVGTAPEQRIALTPERPTPRRAHGRYLWELGALEREAPLPPGVKITYFIEAKDNDAVLGPKTARSRSLTLVLRGKVDPASVDRAALEALLEETLAALADRLDAPVSERSHAALAALAAHYAAVSKTPEEKSATPTLRKLTGEIAARLAPLIGEEAKSARGIGEKIVAELERDVLALDDLRGRRRLEEMARIGEEMKRGRDQLKRLFEELRTATSDAQKAELRREIERKLTELEAKMAELRRIAAQAEGEVPDEFLNREALGKQEIKNGVDSIREMLDKGELDKAMAELERMSKSLDRLTGSMNKDLRSFAGERNPEQEKALSALENDLADLSREEREIERESRAIRDRTAKDAEARGGSLKALHERVRAKLADLDRHGADQASDGHMVDPDTLDRMRARARAVGRALEANDLDEAQGMALDARRMAAGLAERLRETEAEREAEAQARVSEGPSPALRRSRRRMAEAEAIARQIEAELSRADSARNPSLGDTDRQRMEELAKRQQAAGQRGEELARRVSQPGQSLDGVPQGVRGDLDGARQQMGEASKQLSRPAPGRGAEAAGQAAERLDSARKQVAQSRQRGAEDSHEGSEKRDEPVRIPGADDSAAPRAFREELLDAMKRGAPHRFEEQVRKYYEELVR